MVEDYHWRELPQVSFLSRQNAYFCHDKTHLLSRQKYACRDKNNKHVFFVTNICRSKRFCPGKKYFLAAKIFCRDKHYFVATNIILSRQTLFCRDKHNCVATKVLSRQAHFCTRLCHFFFFFFFFFVATKMTLMAAVANDRRGFNSERDLKWIVYQHSRKVETVGWVLLYVHRNRTLISDGEPRTATSTFTQLLTSEVLKRLTASILTSAFPD